MILPCDDSLFNDPIALRSTYNRGDRSCFGYAERRKPLPSESAFVQNIKTCKT